MSNLLRPFCFLIGAIEVILVAEILIIQVVATVVEVSVNIATATTTTTTIEMVMVMVMRVGLRARVKVAPNYNATVAPAATVITVKEEAAVVGAGIVLRTLKMDRQEERIADEQRYRADEH